VVLVSERFPEPLDSTSITFGSRAVGASTVFLQFDPIWRGLRRIDAAFVVLDPLDGAQGTPIDVEVDAWRVLEEWHPAKVEWTHKPDLGHPHARGVARTSPPAALRIDVTEWVRYVKGHPHNDYGLALAAPAGPGSGSSFSTGLGTGAAPALEVYGE
jgi:hypothetical protein